MAKQSPKAQIIRRQSRSVAANALRTTPSTGRVAVLFGICAILRCGRRSDAANNESQITNRAYGVGRGCGVGRDLGIGVPRGVGVGVRVEVGVAVEVGVGVGVPPSPNPDTVIV